MGQEPYSQLNTTMSRQRSTLDYTNQATVTQQQTQTINGHFYDFLGPINILYFARIIFFLEKVSQNIFVNVLQLYVSIKKHNNPSRH